MPYVAMARISSLGGPRKPRQWQADILKYLIRRAAILPGEGGNPLAIPLYIVQNVRPNASYLGNKHFNHLYGNVNTIFLISYVG